MTGDGFKTIREHGEGWTSCSCGAKSDVLPSAQARRDWWEAHRIEVSAAAK